jgi:phage host-nuclease inhibitor protein Gam
MIEQMLDQLAEYYSRRDALALQKQELIDTVYTAEIRAKVAEIEAEFTGKGAAVSENIAALEEAVRAETLKAGATVKGSHLMAVWVKGRVSWDSKKLDGMMIVLPQLAAARKEGEPSVTLRKI